MKILTRIRERRRILNREFDIEMLNYLLENVKNWYEFPEE